MNALELKHITKRMGDFSLTDIDFALPAGCVMGLIGENGAGKTTIIRLILNMLKPDSGLIQALGQSSGGTDQWKADVGAVLDQVGIPACLNTRQVGKVMAGIYPNWDQRAFARSLQRLGLPEKKPFSDFSKGMKMKLGIAVALSHDPKLLILDEATSGLDPVARQEVLDILLEFTRDPDHAVLMSSHIVEDLERICDYIGILRQGRLLAFDEKDRLIEAHGVLRCGPERLKELDPSAILGTRTSPYGVEAVVRRDLVPAGMELSPVSLEEIFIAMVKGEKS